MEGREAAAGRSEVERGPGAVGQGGLNVGIMLGDGSARVGRVEPSRREKDRQTDRQTDRDGDRETERQRHRESEKKRASGSSTCSSNSAAGTLSSAMAACRALLPWVSAWSGWAP